MLSLPQLSEIHRLLPEQHNKGQSQRKSSTFDCSKSIWVNKRLPFVFYPEERKHKPMDFAFLQGDTESLNNTAVHITN